MARDVAVTSLTPGLAPFRGRGGTTGDEKGFRNGHPVVGGVLPFHSRDPDLTVHLDRVQPLPSTGRTTGWASVGTDETLKCRDTWTPPTQDVWVPTEDFRQSLRSSSSPLTKGSYPPKPNRGHRTLPTERSWVQV